MENNQQQQYKTEAETNNSNSPEAINQEIKKLDRQECEYRILKKLERVLPTGAEELLQSSQLQEFLDQATSYARDSVISDIVVDRVERQVLANVKSGRWVADAALKGIIGAAAVGAVSKVYGYAKDNLFHKVSADSANPFSSAKPFASRKAPKSVHSVKDRSEAAL